MSGENELKLCPFCGGGAISVGHSAVCSGVKCVSCGASLLPMTNDQAEAAERWNLRATPPGTEVVPEGTVELLGKICARFREIEYQHELNHPHIGDGILYEMLEDLSNTLTDPVRIVPEAEYQRMRKAAKGPA